MKASRIFSGASDIYTHAVICRKRGFRPSHGLACDMSEARRMARALRGRQWRARIVERQQ